VSALETSKNLVMALERVKSDIESVIIRESQQVRIRDTVIDVLHCTEVCHA
jgi:hypothetical protein